MNFQRTDTHPPPPSVHARCWQSECQQGPTTRNYQYMYSGTVKFMHIIKNFTLLQVDGLLEAMRYIAGEIGAVHKTATRMGTPVDAQIISHAKGKQGTEFENLRAGINKWLQEKSVLVDRAKVCRNAFQLCEVNACIYSA